jgi:ABC-type protease/lipase transport system fused ATPase/permease subunit
MHYSTNAAQSTLARSLVRYGIMWPWLGIRTLDDASVKAWMLAHLDRFHFYVPAGHAA